MNFCLFGGASPAVSEVYLLEAERLGESLAHRGHGMIFGGGATGIMGAAARGVSRGDGRIIGIAPSFFNTPGVLYEDCSQLILTKTMDERKSQMVRLSDGFIVLPGGIGTLDEFFEVFTLFGLGKLEKPIAVCNIDGYFDELMTFLDTMTRQGFLSEETRSSLGIFRNPDALLDFLEG